MFSFQTDSESVTKLEKADILELTVRHLHNLRRQNKLYATANAAYTERFRQGFTHCAAEVSQFLNKIDQNANAHLMRHLRDCIQRCDLIPPATQLTAPVPIIRMSSPPVSSELVPSFYSKDFSLNPSSAILKSEVSVNNNYLSNYNQNAETCSTTLNNSVDSKQIFNKSDFRPVLFNHPTSPKKEWKPDGDVWRPW